MARRTERRCARSLAVVCAFGGCKKISVFVFLVSNLWASRAFRVHPAFGQQVHQVMRFSCVFGHDLCVWFHWFGLKLSLCVPVSHLQSMNWNVIVGSSLSESLADYSSSCVLSTPPAKSDSLICFKLLVRLKVITFFFCLHFMLDETMCDAMCGVLWN